MNLETTQERRPVPAWLARAAFLLWLPLMCLVGAGLMVEHWVALPRPSAAAVVAGVAGEGVAGEATREAEGWQVHHFLYAECPCSRAIVDRIVERGAGERARETVVLVGDDPPLEERIRAAGFRLVGVTPSELMSAYGVESAPLLAITDPAGEARYIGGYTARKQGPALRDRDLLTELQAGGTPTPLPVFGCGVSASLQSTLDPLGLKY